MSSFPTGSNIDRIVKNAAFKALVTAAESVLTDITDDTPIKSGTLRRSQTVTQHRTRMTVSISANTPYAHALHEGTGPYEIIPSKHKALAVPVKNWNGPINDNDSKKLPKLSKDGQYVILGKRVRHPGIEGNPWLKRGVEKYLDKIGRYVTLKTREAMREGLK